MSKIPFWLKAGGVSLIICVLFLNNFLLHLDLPMEQSFDKQFSRMGLSHGDEAHVLLTLKHMGFITVGQPHSGKLFIK